MAPPNQYDYALGFTEEDRIYRGDTLRLVIDFGIPITGATVRFTVKKRPQDPDSDAAFKTVSSYFPTSTSAEIYGSATDMNTMEAGEYHSDVQLALSNGDVQTIAGPILFSQDVTRTFP